MQDGATAREIGVTQRVRKIGAAGFSENIPNRKRPAA
jgi:hypothetical protein